MRVVEYSDVFAFTARTREFLLQSEAERCIELGILDRLAAGKATATIGRSLPRPLLWAMEDGATVAGVAMQTLTDQMIVSRNSADGADALAERLHATGWDGRFFVGVVPTIGAVMRNLSARSGRETRRVKQLWTMQLDEVIQPRPAGGRMREGRPGDLAVLERWCEGFNREIEERDDNPARTAENLVAEERVYLWEDGEPRAMAAWGGPTPHGIRISFVYTPPGDRGRGYASNLVAALSARLLSQGRRFCFLFTDQANPTSNHIYETIGYRRVCEVERWEILRGTTGGAACCGLALIAHE